MEKKQNVKKPSLERWVAQLLATQDREISCSDCFDWLSEYVDRELAHEKPDARMQQLAQHIGQCRVCREEYEMLRDLVADASGNSTEFAA